MLKALARYFDLNERARKGSAAGQSACASTGSAFPIVYFVTYRSPGGIYGRCEMFRNAPIASMADVDWRGT